MKTLLLLLLTATTALAATRPDADTRRANRQAVTDAAIWRDAVRQSKSKPDPAKYLADTRKKLDALAKKRADRDKAIADRAKDRKPPKSP